ncbi:MAG TPA: hypothetical protein PLV92_23075, partial [Pirellulaceae bacterium]|nr:hypothetical protein [Pirellulaceae bacterium]
MMSAVFVGRALQATSADEKPMSTELSVVAVALDGAETKFDLAEIDAQGRLIGAGGPTNATLDRLLRLEVQTRPAKAPRLDMVDNAQERPAIELLLKPSGRLFAASVTLADEQFELVRTGSSPTKINQTKTKLSLESVAAVRFAARARSAPSDSKPESKTESKTESKIDSKTSSAPNSKTASQPSVHEHKLPTPLADNDQFVVMLEGRVETIAGVLAGITDERLTFEHD